MEFEVVNNVLAVLEIRKFDGTGSTPGLTPGCMPPSSEPLSDISPTNFQAQSKRLS